MVTKRHLSKEDKENNVYAGTKAKKSRRSYASGDSDARTTSNDGQRSRRNASATYKEEYAPLAPLPLGSDADDAHLDHEAPGSATNGVKEEDMDCDSGEEGVEGGGGGAGFKDREADNSGDGCHDGGDGDGGGVVDDGEDNGDDGEDNGDDETNAGDSRQSLRPSLPLRAKPKVKSFNLSRREVDPDVVVPNGTAGLIRQLKLQNFMCHESFVTNFGKYVNFVIGKNGSGKSAIITALVLVLGGKSNVTNRGKSMRNFVMYGKQSACVTIHISNLGCNAFNFDLFGEMIIIERRIKSGGSSTYRLMSSKGKLISTKSGDVVKMCDSFNIQVSNPMTILNQDTSRNFLNSKNPADKYKFFMRATQLEKLESIYIETNRMQEYTAIQLQKKKQAMHYQLGELKKVEQRYKASKGVEQLSERLTKIHNEKMWSMINDQEEIIDTINEKIEKSSKKIQSLNIRMQENKENLAATQSEKDSSQLQLIELEKESHSLNDGLKNALQHHNVCRSELKNILKQVEGSNNKIKRINMDIKLLQERLLIINTSQKRDMEEEKRQQDVKITSIQNELADKIAEMARYEDKLHKLRQSLDMMNKKIIEFTDEKRSLQYTKEGCLRSIRESKSNDSDQVTKFGSYVPKVLNRIEKDTRFHKRPRGPLGMDIKITDPNMGVAVESCIGGLLNSFVVNDHHDHQLLLSHFKAVIGKARFPSIFTCKFPNTLYNYKKQQHNRYKAIIDYLSIDDHIIMNCLIDQAKVEKILIIESTEECQEVMSLSNAPSRVAYTKNGDRCISRPNYGFYFQDKYVRTRLVASNEKMICKLYDEITEIENKQNDLDARLVELRKEKQQLYTTENQYKSTISMSMKKKFYLDQELQKIQDLEQEDIQIDTRILQEDLQENNDLLLEQQSVVDQQKSLVPECKSKVSASEANVQLMRDKEDNFFKNIDSAKERLTTSEQNERDFLEFADQITRKIKDFQIKIESHKELLTEKQKNLKSVLALTEGGPGRVPALRSIDTIQQEIDLVKKKMETSNKINGDHEKICVEFKQKRHDYLAIKNCVKLNKLFLDKIGEVLLFRLKRIVDVRRMTCLRLRTLFISNLSYRQFRGNIKFDHVKKTLTLSVKPKEEDNTSNSTTKSMSGGERSYTTICLILALWQNTESPFRCLDEFDVFMDMVNRRTSMEMILEMTEKLNSQSTGRQFIFLTPQDMSHLNVKGDISIMKMPDIVRSLHA